MRKIVLGIAGVLSFLLASYAAREGIAWLRREPPVSPSVVARPWVEQVLVPGSVSIDVPWPLEAKEIPVPPEVTRLATRILNLGHEADGLNVMASVTSFHPGTPVSLDGAAEGAVANLKTVPGVRNVVASKRETSALGVRAIELDARVERAQGVPLEVHGIVLVRGDDFIQVLLTSLSDQPLGMSTWKRIRSSIRSPGAN